MTPIHFSEATHNLQHPGCGDLPVAIKPNFKFACNDYSSVWLPSPEELEILKNGGGVVLNIVCSSHPPVAVFATELQPTALIIKIEDHAKEQD